MEKNSNPDFKSMLSYNQSTGVLTWTNHPIQRMNGRLATRKDKHGHLVVRYLGKTYMAHRIAWLLHYGDLPKLCIDHINGVRDDNRIENLRDVSLSMNQQNRKGRTARNKYDAPMGVTFYSSRKTSKPWIAGISINGKRKCLGYFATKEEAGNCYMKARREMLAGNLI